ncbi:MAG: adenylate/guanylate cyclase domain-containing protein, partial [Alphaproteobacteria bacterium]
MPWAESPPPTSVPEPATAIPPQNETISDAHGLEAERREVSVLFSDLSGFTHWSSKLDPEETHAILNRYFEVADEIVASFGGRVDKHIGD